MLDNILQGSPLSSQQERQWRMQGKQWESDQHCWLQVSGRVEPEVLRQALDAVIEQQEILRTRYVQVAGMEWPMQVVEAEQPVKWRSLDLSDLSEQQQEEQLTRLWQDWPQVRQGAALSACLLSRGEQKWVMFLQVAGLCADAMTMRLLVEQMSKHYERLVRGEKEGEEEESLQYLDVVAWQEQMVETDEGRERRAWWQRQQEQATIEEVKIPQSRDGGVFDPAKEEREVTSAQAARMRERAREVGVTLKAFLLSGWQVLLWKLLGQDQFGVGVGCDGRSYQELETALGLYTRYLPLLSDFERDQSFAELLNRTKQSLEEIVEEQEYFTWEEDVARGSSPNFFPISFTVEQWPELLEAAGMQLRMQRRSGWQEPFVVQLSVLEIGEHLWLELHYDRSRLDPQQAQGWLAGLQRLVEQAIATPEMPVSQLPVVSQQEEQWQQEQGEGEWLESPMPPCFHELFEQQVRQWPDALALCDEQVRWSYAQLNAQANQLARALREQGVGAGELVGVCLPRGAGMIVSVLGVLKAGGAYVPLEPEQPAERLALVLTQTQMRVLLTERGVARTLPVPQGWAGRLVCLEEVVWSQYEEENLALSGDGEAVASVIYTSGSTGMPKGVMLRHRNLLAYTQGLLHRVQGQAGWRYATVSTLGADLGNSAIFGALGSGGCLYVVSYATLTQAQRFAELMQQERIDVLKIVPSHLSSLLAGVPVEQRGALLPRERLIVGGERFSVGLREQLREIGPSCEVYNHYGPTETTVGVLMSRVDLWAQEQEEVPLGRPLARSWVAVLDRWGERVPAGVVGELYVGGAGVSAGYLGAQEQTQARFVPVKWRAGERVYRTGDRVRMRQDGQLVFVGRVDRQVKLRGYRIELGEIEAQICRYIEVFDAVVLLRQDEPGQERLVAYVVMKHSFQNWESELRAYLRERVPEYMVPAGMMRLQALPLTSNGKIDYRQLPAPTSTLHASEGTRTELATPSEEVLQGLWQDLLKREQVGVQDNFFQLGGHSLLATQVIARLRSLLGVEVPLLILFEAPTLEAFARRIDALRREQHGMELPPLLPVSRQHPLPLSFAQQRLWFLEQLTPGTSVYNKPAAMRLSGRLHLRALQRSLHEIVRRHEILRTTFHEQEGQAVQVIGASSAFDRGYWDLRGLEQEAQEQEVSRLVQQEARRPFDLERGPLLRVGVVTVRPDEHLLLLTMHHIVSDGWSNTVFMNEISQLYRAFVAGQPSPLPELDLHYADYAMWQRGWLQGAVLEEQMDYWREQLREVPPLNLPSKAPRPLVWSHRGAHCTRLLPASLHQQLKLFSQCEQVTLFMTLLAGFQIWLMRVSGQEDIAVGTPIANRQMASLEPLIGFFVNTLVLRTDLSGAPGVRTMLQRVREVALGAYAHQDMPFEKIVEEVQPSRDLSRSPLFQVMLSLQQFAQPTTPLPDLRLAPVGASRPSAKFDLSLTVGETAQGLRCGMEYNTDLFDEAMIVRGLEQLERVLVAMVQDPEQPITRLPLLSAQEQEQMVEQWNATHVFYQPSLLLHQRVEQQVERTPEAIAVVSAQGHLSYGALEQRANQLAWYLREQGVGIEGLVGVCLERSLDLVVALLAILKAGGAYVPLDPQYPQERISYMLHDAQVSVVLTQSGLRERCEKVTGVQVLCLDQVGEEIASQPRSRVSEPEEVSRAVERLAYMIYTSGSTGRPKGAMNTHLGIGNRLLWGQSMYQLTSQDRILQKTPYSFDVSLWEFFWPLLTGARVVLAAPGEHRDPMYLKAVLDEQAITIVHFVPSMLQTFLQVVGGEPCGSLRQVICSGEALSLELQERFWASGLGAVKLSNLYGPTEAAVEVSFWDCVPEPQSRSVPIGRPISNLQLYVLDADWQAVPIGVVGELYIAGVGLGRGYHGRADLSAERFLPHPLSQEPGARMYRTGDLAFFRADGAIVFVGRSDGQVKVRGLRIELGEIEAVLEQHPGVRQAAVLLQETSRGEQELVGYVVAEEPVGVRQVRSLLLERLPEYMVPNRWVWLSAMAAMESGKIDRRALLALGGVPESEEATEEGEQEESTPIEQLVAQAWSSVLGVQRVRREDNFFELGGHSLLATQVISRLRTVFGVELPIVSLFEAPTIAGLAREVEAAFQGERHQAIPPLRRVSREQALPLSFAQQRLWFLEQLTPGTTAYTLPLAVWLTGPLSLSAFARSLQEMVHRHEILRTTFPNQDGEPVQRIGAVGGFGLLLTDLRGLPQQEAEGEAERLARQQSERPFDLERGPLVRGAYLQVAAERGLFVFTMHHIVSDGWSNTVFMNEISQLYRAFVARQPSPLPALALHYADYAAWQRSWLQGTVMEQERRYWQARLRDLAPLDLPTDWPRPPVLGSQGARISMNLPASLSEQLRRLSQQEEVTLFMTLLTGFQVLLGRLSQQEDVAVGTSIANRNRVEIEPLIGFFVNTLVLRTDLSGQPGVREVLRRVRRGTLEAYEHQDVPFEQVVEAVQPERDLSRSPLFQVMFVLQNTPRREGAPFAGLKMQPVNWEQQQSTKVDLALVVADGSQQLRCSLQYNGQLFARESMQLLLEQWERVLEAMVADVEQPITRISLLSVAQREHLLYAWNRSQKPLEASVCLHELIELQAQGQPEAVALVYEEDQLTYGSLEQRANQLGWFLQEQGVGPEVRVGLCMERSVEMVIALLAILKAGGAYVPLDPHYPQKRLASLLHDAGCKLVLTRRHLSGHVPETSSTIVCLDDVWSQASRARMQPLPRVEQMEQLAYVIYTSGSTGVPKGVAVTHRGIGHLAQEQGMLFGVSRQSRELQFASLSFDASISEIAVALVSGATLCLAPQERLLPGGALEQLVQEQAITLLTLPPSVLEQVSEQQMPGVEMLVVAGEASRSGLLERWAQGRRVVNAYGPTEATVCACGGQYQPGQAVTIGYRLAHIQLYVLDEQMEPVPLGVCGELYIGGAGVARGYHGRADLTAECFVPDPFGEQAGSRLYKTGDQVRRRGDGRLEFVGRRDGQVKLRGYRIEVGEIENVISQHLGVQSCVVMLREDRVGDQRLVAYLVSKPGAVIVEEQLRQHMRRLLPEYMQPNHLIQLEALPLSLTGKVDRRALPAPKATLFEHEGNNASTPIGELLVEIWRGVLDIENVGMQDNFFSLGGHSLLAAQLISRVRTVLQVEVPLRSLFEAPTLAGMAEYIELALLNESQSLLPAIKPVSRDGHLPLSFAQRRLWFLHQMEPATHAYNISQAMRLQGRLDTTALEQSLREIVRRHEILRTTFAIQEGEPVQIIHPIENYRLLLIDLSALAEPEREEEAQRLAKQESQQPFNLMYGPLLRTTLAQLDEDRYLLLVTMHHIISDGWSNTVFVREFIALYTAFTSHNQSPLPELPIQYADFAAWQHQQLQGELLEEQLRYWRRHLGGAIPLTLPTDRPRPRLQSYRGGSHSFVLSADLSQELLMMSHRENVTLFMLLLAAFQNLLYRISGQRDIVVGTDIAGRSSMETEALIGFFVNLLVLRTNLGGKPTFRTLLSRVRKTVLDAYTHQDTPFDMLIDMLLPDRSVERNPLVRVLFVLGNVPPTDGHLPGLEVSPLLGIESTTSKFDLALFMSEKAGRIGGSLRYSADLFDPDTIANLVARFEVLLNSIVVQPDLSIDELDIYTFNEKAIQAQAARERYNTRRSRLREARGMRQELSEDQ